MASVVHRTHASEVPLRADQHSRPLVGVTKSIAPCHKSRSRRAAKNKNARSATCSSLRPTFTGVHLDRTACNRGSPRAPKETIRAWQVTRRGSGQMSSTKTAIRVGRELLSQPPSRFARPCPRLKFTRQTNASAECCRATKAEFAERLDLQIKVRGRGKERTGKWRWSTVHLNLVRFNFPVPRISEKSCRRVQIPETCTLVYENLRPAILDLSPSDSSFFFQHTRLPAYGTLSSELLNSCVAVTVVRILYSKYFDG